MNQLTLFDILSLPTPKPKPIEFEVGDQVVGQHIKTGQTISGTVTGVGWKYLILHDDRAIFLKTAKRSLKT